MMLVPILARDSRRRAGLSVQDFLIDNKEFVPGVKPEGSINT
jgi:hypothetical protein